MLDFLWDCVARVMFRYWRWEVERSRTAMTQSSFCFRLSVSFLFLELALLWGFIIKDPKFVTF